MPVLNSRFTEESYWSESWIRHIETYLKATPRCGIWLKSRFTLGPKHSVLECAGGSCRDARYLHKLGVSATGSDFDGNTLNYLAQRFPGSDFSMEQQDAFSLSYGDRSFDIVFHNGFWVLFADNGDVIKLLKEQARVAARFAVAIVHNKDNFALVKQFATKSAIDDLYKIRFFQKEELEQIVRDAGIGFKSFSIEKFGGSVDKLYSLERNLPLLKRVIRWTVPRLYRFQPWRKVERIAIVIELG